MIFNLSRIKDNSVLKRKIQLSEDFGIVPLLLRSEAFVEHHPFWFARLTVTIVGVLQTVDYYLFSLVAYYDLNSG